MQEPCAALLAMRGHRPAASPFYCFVPQNDSHMHLAIHIMLHTTDAKTPGQGSHLPRGEWASALQGVGTEGPANPSTAATAAPLHPPATGAHKWECACSHFCGRRHGGTHVSSTRCRLDRSPFSHIEVIYKCIARSASPYLAWAIPEHSRM